MLQKPSVTVLDELIESHLFLMDIGIWLLSDRAVELLIRKSHNRPDGEIGYYDLYSDFGLALGEEPSRPDPEIGSLSVAILPLEGGEFYHYGTSRELISSTLALQNLIADQREIKQRKKSNRIPPFSPKMPTSISPSPRGMPRSGLKTVASETAGIFRIITSSQVFPKTTGRSTSPPAYAWTSSRSGSGNTPYARMASTIRSKAMSGPRKPYGWGTN